MLCTVNRTLGSNPSLSAIFVLEKPQSITWYHTLELFFMLIRCYIKSQKVVYDAVKYGKTMFIKRHNKGEKPIKVFHDIEDINGRWIYFGMKGR